MIISKPIKCLHCQFETPLVTKIDEEGLAEQRGWGTLKDHHYKQHPQYAAALDAWISGSTEHRIPLDVGLYESDGGGFEA